MVRFVITEFFRKPHEQYEDFTGVVQFWFHKNGNTKRYRKRFTKKNWVDYFYDEDGKLHNDYEQPAIINTNGNMEYWLHGKKHRGHFEPAVVNINGTKEYWVYGDKRFETAFIKRNTKFFNTR